MKPIRDLEIALNNQQFYKAQFEESGYVKNVLFVSPHLTPKHVYKYILPYFCMQSGGVATAITSVENHKFEKYDDVKNLKPEKSVLLPQHIIWADFIVFPFILNRLGGTEEDSLYNQIKKINPDVKIVYHVDFNFYRLPKRHPYYKLFDRKAISNVEDNIYFCDLCLTSNMEFYNELHKIIEKLAETTYKDYPPTLKLGNVPILFDLEVLLMNVDYDPEKPTVIDNRKVKKTAEVAESEKKKASSQKQTSKKSTKSKTNGTKSTTAKSGGKPNGGSTTSGKGKTPTPKSGGKSTGGSTGTTRRRGRPPKSESKPK